MLRPPLLAVLLLLSGASATGATPEALLQATRPDVPLLFRFCVPTTVEQEAAYWAAISTEVSPAEELVAKIPPGPERARIALETRQSEQRYFAAVAAWWAEFGATLQPGDTLYRYAFEIARQLESGLLVVRDGEIAARRIFHKGTVLPGLAVASRYSNAPADEEALLRELAQLLQPTGVAERDREKRLLIGERSVAVGETCSVVYFDRTWKLTLESLEAPFYTLRLGGHTLRLRLPK